MLIKVYEATTCVFVSVTKLTYSHYRKQVVIVYKVINMDIFLTNTLQKAFINPWGHSSL